MRRLLLIASVLVVVFGTVGMATAADVTFDFEALSSGASSTAISAYMTGLYGSAVTVSATGSPEAEGGFFTLLGPDKYIESEPDRADQAIIITFATPISAVSFDWGSALDDFYADADGVNFFFDDYNLIKTGSTSFVFATPVYSLSFHDGGIGEIGIDNLKVTSVPEPGTLVLLGSGLLGLVGYGRKRLKK